MTALRQMLFAVLMLVAGPVMAATDRVAMVIGQAKYLNIDTLDNTVRDADLIAQTLTEIGFEVIQVKDAGYQDLRQALDRFAFRSETADLALIYYAGHGVEVQGTNYLIPVDADVQSYDDVKRQSVSLNDLLAAVDRARVMRVVILDSCRNNPFGDTLGPSGDTGSQGSVVAGGDGGLAPPSPDRGTLVAFAARDGQVSLDGLADNSPFAIALADKMRIPGLEISLMFRQVRDAVLASTLNQQEPNTYGSLSGVPFYLAGPGEGQADPAADARVAWAQVRPEQEAQLAALADLGDTRSMLGLAQMRLNPEAKVFDPKEAFDLLTRAAAAGSPEAQFELAKLYEQGIGVEPDPVRALDLYQQAAAQDFADAINDLGFMHYQGGLGLPPDPAAALTFFERAANLRHPQALFNFAALIDDGRITGKDKAAAAGYLYDALRSGSRDVLDILTEKPNMFSLETRKALQGRLSDAGFYSGALDGAFGPGTVKALRLAFGLKT
ncbi:MAG: caspase family protein [Gemmobacter sp.]